jgi:hypothetical protein
MGAAAMSDEKYNGWTNRATWMVNLWMSNDEGFYREYTEMASRASSVGSFAAELEEHFGDTVRECAKSSRAESEAFVNDIMAVGLESVDWDEIATSWYDENHDEEADPDEE